MLYALHRYIIVYFRYLNSQESLCIKYCLPWLFSAKYLSGLALVKMRCPNEMPYPYRTTINKFSLVHLNTTHLLPGVVQLLPHRKLLYLSRKKIFCIGICFIDILPECILQYLSGLLQLQTQQIRRDSPRCFFDNEPADSDVCVCASELFWNGVCSILVISAKHLATDIPDWHWATLKTIRQHKNQAGAFASARVCLQRVRAYTRLCLREIRREKNASRGD